MMPRFFRSDGKYVQDGQKVSPKFCQPRQRPDRDLRLDSTAGYGYTYTNYLQMGSMRNQLVVCFLSLTLTTCVSVQLPGGKSEPAKGVNLQVPSSPFKEIQSPQIDKSWQSTKTGNTISYFSTCGSSADPSLESLESDALNALNKMEVQSSDEVSFNGRSALQSLAKGHLDGVPVQISVLVFKKNNCNYTLTYGGIEQNFNTEVNVFESFKNSFKAP